MTERDKKWGRVSEIEKVQIGICFFLTSGSVKKKKRLKKKKIKNLEMKNCQSL